MGDRLNLEAPAGRGRPGPQAEPIHTPGDLQAPKCNIRGSIGPRDQALPWAERIKAFPAPGHVEGSLGPLVLHPSCEPRLALHQPHPHSLD